MSARLIVVRDGPESIAPSLAAELRKANLPTRIVARLSLAVSAPGDIVLLRMTDTDPIRTCWQLRRQGHRWIVALSLNPSTGLVSLEFSGNSAATIVPKTTSAINRPDM